jgi:hypothetical protein
VSYTGLGADKDGKARIVAKRYGWYPTYFSEAGTKQSKVTTILFIFFGPLFWLDVRFWHTDDAIYTKKYRVVPFNGDTYISKFDRDSP